MAADGGAGLCLCPHGCTQRPCTVPSDELLHLNVSPSLTGTGQHRSLAREVLSHRKESGRACPAGRGHSGWRGAKAQRGHITPGAGWPKAELDIKDALLAQQTLPSDVG